MTDRCTEWTNCNDALPRQPGQYVVLCRKVQGGYGVHVQWWSGQHWGRQFNTRDIIAWALFIHPPVPIAVNSPFERVPQHAADPGFGPVPPEPDHKITAICAKPKR